MAKELLIFVYFNLCVFLKDETGEGDIELTTFETCPRESATHVDQKPAMKGWSRGKEGAASECEYFLAFFFTSFVQSTVIVLLSGIPQGPPGPQGAWAEPQKSQIESPRLMGMCMGAPIGPRWQGEANEKPI